MNWMKFEVNIEKKYAFAIIGLIIFIGLAVGVIANWDVAKTVWHDANDVKVRVNSQDYSLQEVIDNGTLGGGYAYLTVEGCASTSSPLQCPSGWNLFSTVLGVSHGSTYTASCGVSYTPTSIVCRKADTGLSSQGSIGYVTTNTVIALWGLNRNPYDISINLPYNTTSVRRIIATAIGGSQWGWPIDGTKYIFDGGSTTGVSFCTGTACNNDVNNLPFNKDVLIFAKTDCGPGQGSGGIYLNVSVANPSNPGGINTYPIKIRAYGDGCDNAGTMGFNISYERYCVMNNGVCADYFPV
jgi:hypothetical protein